MGAKRPRGNPNWRKGVSGNPKGRPSQQLSLQRPPTSRVFWRAERLRLFLAQHGLCAICGATLNGERSGLPCLDHNHRTGAIREVLCPRCNKAIGLFDDDPVIMESAAAYVRKHEARVHVEASRKPELDQGRAEP